MNHIAQLLLKLYRSERTINRRADSPWAKRFYSLASLAGGAAAREGLAQIDHWTALQPFKSTKRLFGAIDSIRYVPARDGTQRTIIRGWLFDLHGQIESIYLWNNHDCIASGPVWEPREDVSAVFPAESRALMCGFEFFVEQAFVASEPVRFSARLLTGEMVQGIFEIPSMIEKPVGINVRTVPAPERAPLRGAFILAEVKDLEDPQFIKIRAAAAACATLSISARIILLNRSPSSTSHLLREFPTLTVIRSVEEFAFLISGAESPSALFALDADALWYCDRLMRMETPLFSKLSIIDDSRAFSSGTAKDPRPHMMRSRFCQVLIEPQDAPPAASAGSVVYRFRLKAPSEFSIATMEAVYQKAIEHLVEIS